MMHRKMHIPKTANLVWLVALGMTIPALGQDGSFEFPPARVEVAKAEMREMAPAVDVSGTVVSLNDSQIASEVAGVLTWLADVGDSVDAGDHGLLALADWLARCTRRPSWGRVRALP